MRAHPTRLILAALAALLLAVPASAAAARTIRAGRFGLSALGAFHPRGDASPRRAIAVFGSPTRGPRLGRSGCPTYWRRLRLRIVFADFGGAGACSRRFASAQSVVIGSSRRWRTAKGLRVGHRVSRLRALYPRAERHGSRWWLRAARSPFGEGGRYAVLAARTSNGRVSGFKGWIGAAGE